MKIAVVGAGYVGLSVSVMLSTKYQVGLLESALELGEHGDDVYELIELIDGMEDSVMTMEDFAEGHLRRGTVISLTVKKPQQERTDAV